MGAAQESGVSVTSATLGDVSVAGPGWGRQAVRIWLVLIGLMLLLSSVDIFRGNFPDPDDALRLAQVRDLIAGQGWFDLHQYRIDPQHGGVLMHWSRLVDAPLAALILLLRPLFGQPAAETVTMVAVPLLIFGGVLALVCRLANRWLDKQAALYSCIALALSVPALQQLVPLRIDHHGWQILMAMGAVSALFASSQRTGGLIAGAALAVGLSISLEALPLAAVLVGLTALRWLRDPADRGWTLYTMLGLGALSPLLFLATRGVADLELHCDIVTPVHLAVFGWGTVAVGALAALNPRSRVALIGGFAAIGAVAVGIALGAAPQCAGGAFGQLDPLTRELWYDRVHEGLPIWHQTLPVAASLAVSALIGLQAAVRLALAAPTPERRVQWLEYSLILGAAIAISFLVARAGGVAGALAAIPLGWQLRQWIPALSRQRHLARKAAGIVGLMLAMVPSGPLSLARAALPQPKTVEGEYSRLAMQGKGCTQSKMPRSIGQLGSGRILAPLDLGPELLADTQLEVIATGHHRGDDSMRAVISTFIGPAEAAHARVREMKADFVMLCPTQTEVLNYRYLRPDGFAAQLSKGQAPSWLEPVELPEARTRFKVWRVVD